MSATQVAPMNIEVWLGVQVEPCLVSTRQRCAPPGLVLGHVYEVARADSGDDTSKLPVSKPSGKMVSATRCSLPAVAAGTQLRSATPVREPVSSQRGFAVSWVAAPEPPGGPMTPSSVRAGAGELNPGVGDTKPGPSGELSALRPTAPQPAAASARSATAGSANLLITVRTPYVRSPQR